MKVILVQDVARLGKRSEVKDVPKGHATNFLIPRKLAIAATPANLKQHSAMVSKLDSQKVAHEETFQETLNALKEKTITHTLSANEKGHLFSGVSAEVVATILKEAGQEVDASAIKLGHPIKELGTFTIDIEKGDHKGVCTLEIINQK